MRRSILLGLFLCVSTLFSEEATKYTVVKGDNLWDLASQYLGSGFEWQKIWNANKQVKNPDLIYPGDILLIQGGKVSVVRSTGETYDLGTTTRGDTALYANSLRGVTGQKSLQDSLLKAELSNNFKEYLSKFRAIVQRETPIIHNLNDSVIVQVGRINDNARHLYIPYQKVRVVFDSTSQAKKGELYEIFEPAREFKSGEESYRAFIPVATGVVLGSRGDSSVIELQDVYGEVKNESIVVKAREPIAISKLVIDSTVQPLNGMDIIAKLSTGAVIVPYSYVIVKKGSADGVRLGDLLQGYPLEKEGGDDYYPSLLGVVSYVGKTASTVMVVKVLSQTSRYKYSFIRVGNIAFK